MKNTFNEPMPSITDMLRERLKPRGTANISTLELGSVFYHSDFIEQCIQELERIPAMAAVGEMPSPLQKLAYDILINGCHLEMDIKNAEHRATSEM